MSHRDKKGLHPERAPNLSFRKKGPGRMHGGGPQRGKIKGSGYCSPSASPGWDTYREREYVPSPNTPVKT